MLRVEDGSFFDLRDVGLYADRETAELMARNYNKMFGDPIPAEVIELEVKETSPNSQLKAVQRVYAVHTDLRAGAYGPAIRLFGNRLAAEAFVREYRKGVTEGFAEVLPLEIEQSFEPGAVVNAD